MFSSDTSKGRKLRVAVMFVPEYQAYLAVGFTETALQLDYYEQMSFVRSEFQDRGGFTIEQPQLELEYDQNSFLGQDALLFGIQLQFIQRYCFC